MAINSYEKIARTVLQGADPVTGKDGRLYLDGTMTPAVLSEAIAEALYVGEIFRDGQSVTKKYTVNAKVGDMVRVPLETPFPSSSRTLALANRPGTEGNGGILNKNAPMLPSDDEFAVFMNQVNDQMILFPEMSEKWLPLNAVATRLAGYAKTVIEDRSASTLAEIIAYNVYRALGGADNINNITVATEGAYGDLMNTLNTKLDNGDEITNAHSYSTEGRCIIGRPSFVNGMLNRKSGVILTGSDLAQSMLKEYKFDTEMKDRDYVGNSYKGEIMGFAVQSAADYIWTLAEKYLGLQAGALDHVLAIAVSAEATAASDNIDLGVKMIDANEVRGLKAQPLNCWGHEAFRLSQLIGDTSLTTDSLKAAGFAEGERKYPCHPSELKQTDKISVPVYDTNGVIIGYQVLAQVPAPNGGKVQSGYCTVKVTVLNTDGSVVKDATVSVTAPTGVTVTNNGDGSYQFNVDNGVAVTASVSKSGLTTQSITLSKKDTKEASVVKVITMAAAG